MTEVVAALIWEGGKFMICQRPAHKARGLLWEFVAVDSELLSVVHEYPDITIRLTVFNASIAEGVPQLLEHNDIRWILPSEIKNYDFCPADDKILEKIIEVCHG